MQGAGSAWAVLVRGWRFMGCWGRPSMEVTRWVAAALVLVGKASPPLLLPLTTLRTVLTNVEVAPPLLGSLEGGAEPHHAPMLLLALLLLLLLLLLLRVLQPNPWGLRQLALLAPVPLMLLLLLVRAIEKPPSPVLLLLPGLVGLAGALLVMLLSKLLLLLLLLSLDRDCTSFLAVLAAPWGSNLARSCCARAAGPSGCCAAAAGAAGAAVLLLAVGVAQPDRMCAAGVALRRPGDASRSSTTWYLLRKPEHCSALACVASIRSSSWFSCPTSSWLHCFACLGLMSSRWPMLARR